MNRKAKSRVTRRTLLIAGSSSMVAAGILGACAPFGSDETAPEFTETTSAVGLSERAARGAGVDFYWRGVLRATGGTD